MTTASGIRHEAGTEGLRGFAALLVLYTHLLWVDGLDSTYTPWQGFMALEASQGAVLLFFILSGYVIGMTNHRPFTFPNWIDYLKRRVVRLAPICWIAIALSLLVRPGESVGVVLGNVLFLQNLTPYGDFSIPVLSSNFNLWTLNYEALYYLLFAVCWLRPQAWKLWLGAAFILSIVCWQLPGNWAPLTACYAVGWIFWLTGYGLSQLKFSPASTLPLPWISVGVFWLATWQQKPLWFICRRFDLLPAADVWVTYAYIDIIPSSIVLLLAASGRRPSGTRLLCWISALIPLTFLLWTALRGRFEWWPLDRYTVFCLLGCLLWKWRPDGERAWGRLAWIGSISYGLYILQRPAQWFVHDAGWLPSGNAGAFILRLALALALTFAAAWFVERKLYPVLRHKFLPRRPTPAPSA